MSYKEEGEEIYSGLTSLHVGSGAGGPHQVIWR